MRLFVDSSRFKSDPIVNSIGFDFGSVANLDIPESAKAFLAREGLPAAALLDVRFESWNGTFPTLGQYCDDRGWTRDLEAEEFYRVGTDGETQLCIQRGSGHVVSIDPKHRYITRFVNSSIGQYISFLHTYSRYCKEVDGVDDDSAQLLVQRTQTYFEETDLQAIVVRESWWSTILEQMRMGMA
ncbi:hypothetical protein ETAA8_15870 [Anatilimnocola aggregata]|uniref:SUKH-4 immunity protein of toxin-antitoxin system n=1 Tax=Anatilimnocola aggregata TaxID=2528021 RepID=A0A517Y8C8_9BACT|nr:SUKH-4 family immunity protein [Anatilimnocola aggregata]QDU26509.1 hypothetical protein ETAA8_15870 [Anatilimnocola aggregata]